MVAQVLSISAQGTRGSVKGAKFIAKPDSQGRYVLNKKSSAPTTGNMTRKAVNKVYASSLDEVAALLETNAYLVNLIGPRGQRALRELKKVTITRIG